ncbi:hypothetical protein QUB00_26685 [Microcoleus sp. F8_C2]
MLGESCECIDVDPQPGRSLHHLLWVMVAIAPYAIGEDEGRLTRAGCNG